MSFLFSRSLLRLPLRTRQRRAPNACPAFVWVAYLSAYFRRVAWPPRMCRSALLKSSTRLTLFANSGLIRGKRSVTSLCTVLFETPNSSAVLRTVSLVRKMWLLTSSTRFQI